MKRTLNIMRTRIGRTVMIGLALAAGLAGCEQPNQEMMNEWRLSNARMDMELYRSIRPELVGGVTLERAVELALEYNTDLWLARQEAAIQRELETASLLKMLPEMTVDVNFDHRNRYNASASEDLQTGTSALARGSQYSFSQEKDRFYGGIGMLWNVVDFGVSYHRARQETSRTLIAGQSARRVRQDLVMDVAATYWRCLMLRGVARKARELEGLIDAELARIAEALAKRQVSESVAIARRYPLKKQKMRIQEYVEKARAARVRLAKLMGLPVHTEFALATVADTPPGAFDADVETLERYAVLNRPELFECDLRQQISYDEAKATLISMFPSPGIFLRLEADTNEYLYYQNWYRAGLNVSWDLLSIPSRILTYKAHKKRQEHLAKYRQAVAAGILVQLNLAMIEHNYTLRRLRQARDLTADCRKIADNMTEAVQAGKGKAGDVVVKEMAFLDEYAAEKLLHARLMAARAKVYNSIGYDVVTADGQLRLPDLHTAPAVNAAKVPAPQTQPEPPAEDAPTPSS